MGSEGADYPPYQFKDHLSLLKESLNMFRKVHGENVDHRDIYDALISFGLVAKMEKNFKDAEYRLRSGVSMIERLEESAIRYRMSWLWSSLGEVLQKIVKCD